MSPRFASASSQKLQDLQASRSRSRPDRRRAVAPGDYPRHSFGRSRANPPDAPACSQLVTEVKSQGQDQGQRPGQEQGASERVRVSRSRGPCLWGTGSAFNALILLWSVLPPTSVWCRFGRHCGLIRPGRPWQQMWDTKCPWRGRLYPTSFLLPCRDALCGPTGCGVAWSARHVGRWRATTCRKFHDIGVLVLASA